MFISADLNPLLASCNGWLWSLDRFHPFSQSCVARWTFISAAFPFAYFTATSVRVARGRCPGL